MKLECYRLAHERGVKGSSEVSHDREQQLRRNCASSQRMSRILTAAPKQQDDYDAIVGVVVNTLADH